jgi:nickel-dependent lactate racemase
MHAAIDFGLDHLDVEVPESKLVTVHQPAAAPPLADPAGAVRAALEAPLGFPALRRALTPDDHVAIVVDERLPHLPELLTPILEHVTEAAVAPEAITLLCPPTANGQPWVDDLPDAFQEVHVEVHDPTERRKLSYLATTRHGRRLYLNRTAVDADQLVVLTHRGYDPLLGYSGAEGALYPVLSDEATQQEMTDRLSLIVPGKAPWPVRQEAAEVAWLLGAPFFVQVIEGSGEDVLHVVGGLTDTSEEGQRLLDARWRMTVDQPASLVVAGLGGDPARHDFADLARALITAARVVQPNGKIVLLTGASPELGAASALLRRAEDPGQALEVLRQQKPADMAAAYQWASAAQKASIYLLSGIPSETAEELFAIPLEHAGQVQRLLSDTASCLLLPDAHKTLAVLDENNGSRKGAKAL